MHIYLVFQNYLSPKRNIKLICKSKTSLDFSLYCHQPELSTMQIKSLSISSLELYNMKPILIQVFSLVQGRHSYVHFKIHLLNFLSFLLNFSYFIFLRRYCIFPCHSLFFTFLFFLCPQIFCFKYNFKNASHHSSF